MDHTSNSSLQLNFTCIIRELEQKHYGKYFINCCTNRRNVTITSFLLLSVFNDARCVDYGDPLQQLVWHLNADQSLQKVLAELL